MKQTLSVLLTMALLFSTALHAQTESTSISELPSSESKSFLPSISFKRFNFYLNALPFLSESFGGSILYRANESMGIWINQERTTNSTGAFLDVLGPETKVVATNFSAGFRQYFSGFSQPGFYIQMGYFWGTLDISHSPPLFRGVRAEKRMYLHGLTTGFGYSWQRPTTPWKMEIGAKVEPRGLSSRIRYVEDEPGILGPKKAHLENINIVYTAFLDARLGYSF